MLYFVSRNAQFLKHISSGKLVNQEAFTHKKRTLDTFVLIVVLQGSLHIAQDGVKHTLSANQFILLFPGHEHYGYQASQTPLVYYWCHFHARDGYTVPEQEEAGRYLFMLRSDNGGQNLGDIYFLPEHGEITAGDRVSLLYRQLLDLANRESYTTSMADCVLSLLVMEITQNYIDTASVDFRDSSKAQRQMAEIMAWIQMNRNIPLTVQHVAEAFSYNPDYLSTTFRKTTGLSLLKYIHRAKIAYAKELLLSSPATIKQIAQETGFQDEKNFMKVFKGLEDVTPTQYRNAYFRTHLNKT